MNGVMKETSINPEKNTIEKIAIKLTNTRWNIKD